MPVLYFVRHGETDWNREGRLQGQTDIPLNANGRRQAVAVASHFTTKTGLGFSRDDIAAMPFYVSPMARARQTMDLLLESLGMPEKAYETEDRLKEISFGQWEGKTWPELRQVDPKGASARNADKWGFVPPDGENYEMVAERVRGWLATIDRDVCVVAHGGIARVVLVLLAGRARKEAVQADIWQGKVLRVSAGQSEWVPGPGHH